MRSTTPWKASPTPIGNCMRIASQPSFSRTCWQTRTGSAPARSSLLMNRQSRHMVPLHLAVDGQRLCLHAADAAEHQDRAVQHAEAALHFDREIDVARSVDQVDLVLPPLDRRRGTGDGDAAFLFELHVVHRGTAPSPCTSSIRWMRPGVEEDPLAERRLARVDVSGNADVSQVSQIHVLTRSSEKTTYVYPHPAPPSKLARDRLERSSRNGREAVPGSPGPQSHDCVRTCYVERGHRRVLPRWDKDGRMPLWHTPSRVTQHSILNRLPGKAQLFPLRSHMRFFPAIFTCWPDYSDCAAAGYGRQGR